MKEEKRFYNYIYLDPTKSGEYKYQLSDNQEITFNNEPFYVGKGCGNRSKQHKYGHSKGFMKSKIQSLDKKGVKPIIIEINTKLSEFESCQNEKCLIKVIGRRILKLGPLVNLTEGGEGTSGYRHTNDAKIKMSIASKGKVYTKEYRRNLSEARKGKKFTQDHKNNISKANKGKVRSKEFGNIVAQRNSKSIDQFDTNNIFIKSFKSIKEAQDIFKISHISKVCRGKLKSSGGFIWKYKNN